MVQHNNIIPNQHFKKDWQENVRTWFNQPARKLRRRKARAAKAEKISPRPVAGLLRPIVKGQTVRYNSKTRLGRGFTLEELKEAEIPAKLAPTIGIAVDTRRKNKCLESLQANVARLKAYKSKLIIFPRKAGKPKAGDATEEELATAEQLQGALMPIAAQKGAVEAISAITDEQKSFKAYGQLRLERMNSRLEGMRKKRAEEEAAAEKEKSKAK
mmetsp:Transcript_13396/g.48759  ORF Transcript_13396/g.48759 Transcript_13396/m.48759 type:complete len:214 (-) Transcript_13396:143-784(-)